MPGADGEALEDQPVRLSSAQAWTTREVTLAEIVAELVKLALPTETVENAFKIEQAYYESLSPHQTVLETAAMIEWLRRLGPQIAHQEDGDIFWKEYYGAKMQTDTEKHQYI
jgi:hypothetical protein